MRAFSIALVAFAAFSAVTAEDLEKGEHIPTSCPDEDSPDGAVLLAHERDCTQYYMCSGGFRVLMRCSVYMDATGHKYLLHFNPKAQACDWPARAGCKGYSCPKDSKGRVIREAHETDCTKYYDCLKDKRDLRECPHGEKFHRLRLECVKKYDCDKKDAICPPMASVRLPHETDCERYYQCKNGKATIKTCPNGLHYNRDIHDCDHPDHAGCKRI